MYENLAYLAAFVFFYSIISGKLEQTPFNGALVFMLFGLMFGQLGFELLDLNVNKEALGLLAELTLALVLFTDASSANLDVLRQSFRIPQRLLLIGLPLTIILGFLVGLLLFNDLSMLEIAILATMLAPTDAALGKAVVTDERVPSKIREGLNVESGLNDGICVPILFVFIALVGKSSGETDTMLLALKLVGEEIGIGLIVGFALAGLGSFLIRMFAERGWITETWQQLPVVALAISCFAVAQMLGGSGFIAAFAGGLLFGGLTRQHKHTLLLAAEGTGDTLALITWVMFGSGVVGQVAGQFSWQVLLYSILSLTIIRIVPVYLVLYGMNLRIAEKLFMGWFGPRGLASIVFAIIILNKNLPGGDTIGLTVACTIALSVIAHGLSANPLVAKLANVLDSFPKKPMQ